MAYHKNHRKLGVVMFDATTGQCLDGIGHYGYEPITGRNEITSLTASCPIPLPTPKVFSTTLARKFESRATVELDLTPRLPRKSAGARSASGGRPPVV